MDVDEDDEMQFADSHFLKTEEEEEEFLTTELTVEEVEEHEDSLQADVDEGCCCGCC